MHIRASWRLSTRLRLPHHRCFCAVSSLQDATNEVRVVDPANSKVHKTLAALITEFPQFSTSREERAAWRQFQSVDKRTNLPIKDFRSMVREQVGLLVQSLDDRAPQEQLGLVHNIRQNTNLLRSWLRSLENEISSISEYKRSKGGNRPGKDAMVPRLERAWKRDGAHGVIDELRYSIQKTIIKRLHPDIEPSSSSSGAVDLRYPAQWYPLARAMKRQIHLHIGPTNSGKTYHALQRLMSARSGVFGGPLRLLAHEVHARILAKGRSCHLITGDERILSDDPDCSLASSTVEMLPMGMQFDVAVIDEIQMLGDDERGWAWTNAVLGLPAAELHLCGEVRSLKLVQAFAAATGEEVIVHEYKRLSPLEAGKESLDDDLTKLQPGDCVVAFSRKMIHLMANKITRITPYKVAVIYGSLPPDTRAEQARLFNDPNSGYDILVASNAIGMGLNLDIRRVIFQSVVKFNGKFRERLRISDLKQIGGRAGRYRIAPSAKADISNLDIQNPASEPAASERPSAGIVTTLVEGDLEFVQTTMDKEAPPLRTAGIKMPEFVIEAYNAYFPPGTPLSYVLTRAAEDARIGDMFRLCPADAVAIADAIQDIGPLTLHQRLIICSCPVQVENLSERDFLRSIVYHISKRTTADILKLLTGEHTRTLERRITPGLRHLALLEDMHKCLTMYMWLSFRFPASVVSGALASHIRALTEQKISAVLQALAQADKIRPESSSMKTAKDWADEDKEADAESDDLDVTATEQDESENDKSRLQGLVDDLSIKEMSQKRLRDLISEDDGPQDSAPDDVSGDSERGEKQLLRDLVSEKDDSQGYPSDDENGDISVESKKRVMRDIVSKDEASQGTTRDGERKGEA